MQTADPQGIVTIVASDLQGSTALGERLDAEALREVLASYFDAMTAVIEGHGGLVHKIVGDAIIAVFGLPSRAEDDALRAVRATDAGQAALVELNDELDRRWHVRLVTRTGVATGPVAISTTSVGESILRGDVVDLAAALEQAAPPSGILLAETTHRLVADSVTAEATTITTHGGRPSLTAFWLHAVASSDRPTTVRTEQAARRRESRKIVTIVFADLKATTLDGIPFAPDASRPVVARAFDAARGALTRHGGTVEKFIGDAVMAVFGLPVRHEDDAQRAIRAALDLRTDVAALAAPLEGDGVRMSVAIGVNSGEVVAGDATAGQRLVTGDAVNTAARLEQAAGPGVILLGAATHALVGNVADVEEVAPLALKGKAEPVRAFRLLGLGTGAGADVPRGAMVGRAQELAWLAEAFEAAIADRSCQMVTLVGDAGVGKSRLTHEFLASIAERARLVRGRCLPYGDGITYWPIVEVMSAAARIKDTDTPVVARRKLRRSLGDDEVADRIAAAIGLLDAPFQVAELAWGIRRGFEILATERPLVVVFDDIHWAEPTFLELVGRLTATIESASVTLLCTARQELLAKEPSWAEAPGQRRIDLAPLDDADAAAVVDNLLGSAGLSTSVRARVVAAAEGNPLFVEQLVSMLVDSGLLRLADGRWEPAGNIDTMAIPPTIHALLAARLDQLPDDERSVIDPAAVIGLEFEPVAVAAIADEDVRASVPDGLTALEARQLVRRLGSDEGSGAYRFGHLMIRDATYAGLLKRTRAELHRHFVAWIDETYRAHDRATEVEEITGYHLEQAHRYLSELGPLDADGLALGLDASARLASAGERAFGRGDMPATAGLLGRAAALLPDDDPARPRLTLRHGLALWETGEYEAADAALDTAVAEATALGDEGLRTSARLERLMTQFYADPSKVEGRVDAQVTAAIATLEALGDTEGIARAWLAMAGVRMVEAQWGAAAAAIEHVIAYARRAGDEVLALRAAPNLAMCAQYGPTPVDEAIGICEAIVADAAGDRKVEAIALRALAHMHAMRGDFAAAREGYGRARTMLEELGWRFIAALGSIVSGPIELLAGDPVAAEAELRHDYEALDRLGDRNYISTVAGYLAEALYRQGRLDEAATFAAFSRDVADDDDVATQVLWRGVTAKLLAHDGQLEEADRLAREAVERSVGEDDPIDQANALMDRAVVLRLAARADEATDASRSALRLYEAKGNVVAAAEARRLMSDAGAAPATPRG